jgi:uncharacterized protein YndB with AHSA1/START domain
MFVPAIKKLLAPCLDRRLVETKLTFMNTEDIIAKASTTVDASKEKVWEALVTPGIIKQYFFGTEVKSDFKVGSKIVWKGEWDGHKYEDHGEIREAQKNKLLQFTHISPGSGEKDVEENYRIVTIIISESNDGKTKVTLTQDNNPNDEAREKSEKNWQMMLDGLKKVLEKGN